MAKKKFPIIENLLITSIAAEGVSLGRHNDYVIFVSGVIPGDIVDVQLTRMRKAYAESKLLKIREFSKDRIEPFCKHFGTCGGCKWQMLPYEKQLEYKEKQVYDQLTRLGKLENLNLKPIIPAKNDKYYRNKLEYTFAQRRWIDSNEPFVENTGRNLEGLGFHVRGMFDRIVDIDECFLQVEPSNEIRNKLREFTKRDGYDYYNSRTHEGMMRNLMIRTSSLGEIMVVVIFNRDEKQLIEAVMKFLDEEFPNLTSLQYVVNTKFNDSIYDQDLICYKGRSYILEDLDGLKFRIGPKSFFQTNTEQALVLYRKTVEFADIKADELIYDLYTGTGTIANFIAKKCKKVVGIDSVPEAIDDAKKNSELNNIDNAVFYAGDMKDLLNSEFIEKNGKPDTIILDPPRAGVHENVINIMREISAKKIVYVSCNPASQARDISMLSDMYNVVEVQALDMFPHTHHVENIVLMEKK
ncbi:MAG: 23S rRNA (uracil(1939)-C(5))-methyltransferase RlmD [Bacteroidales bacterium]|nr:23S rRNA (uracil(1939)-C(5))-methyltransferase RlmD [Bacteroidales bacterium]OQC45494.1 MAG: 23S rRNA (uracil-C(5))-methyltransferase RlmCD [Bacteroidetes bacterium ADurb.Bin028]HNY44142.1 23S rRNA (uracil(1939)-C(5))-methyltransferase RlmD [Bacteroidales bacterium]HOD88600.1 23S rRNA (uracil(1939)-C(5))-methyltransferase RlmD [Bacteroidales bacterium]